MGVVEMRLGLVGRSLGRAMVFCAHGLYSLRWATVVSRGCNETVLRVRERLRRETRELLPLAGES